MGNEANLRFLLTDAINLVHKIMVEKMASEDLRLELTRWRQKAEMALENIIP